MKKLLALISDSYHEFKHVSTITTCAMFGAMSIVLNQLATIRVTPNLKIGFGALPNELVDYLLALWWEACSAAAWTSSNSC